MSVAIAVAFLVANIGTWLVIRFAPALRLIDRPNERSSHVHPTPRGGGLAIVCAVSMAVWFVPSVHAGSTWLAVAAALPIAMLGLLDDRFGLPAGLRLAVQVTTSLAFVAVATAPGESAATAILGALAIAWACNLFNFMDGIDGIASTEALFITALSGWFIWPHDPALAGVLWVVTASLAGFLPWNWSPARIFLGDVGSAYLGFLVAAIALLSMVRGFVALPVWISLWSLFLADTGVTLARRVIRRERWWSAHRTHAYQHLSVRLASHSAVTVLYSAINLVIVLPCACYAQAHSELAWFIGAFLLLSSSIFVLAFGAGRAQATMRS